MPAGKYRERVTIQRRTETDIGGGERSYTWSDVQPVWAEVVSTGAATVNEHVQQVGDQSYRVTVRKSPVTECLTLENRFLWRGRYLNIGGINFDQTRVEVELFTTQSKGEA